MHTTSHDYTAAFTQADMWPNRVSAKCKAAEATEMPRRQVHMLCSDRWLQLRAIEAMLEVAEHHAVHGSTACPAVRLQCLMWFSRRLDACAPTTGLTP